jgi:hypothetical protein
MTTAERTVAARTTSVRQTPEHVVDEMSAAAFEMLQQGETSSAHGWLERAAIVEQIAKSIPADGDRPAPPFAYALCQHGEFEVAQSDQAKLSSGGRR